MRGGLRGVEPPFIGNTFETEFPTVMEAEARSRDQILHCTGDQNFARMRFMHHPCADMDCNAADFSADHFTFARVQARADLNT